MPFWEIPSSQTGWDMYCSSLVSSFMLQHFTFKCAQLFILKKTFVKLHARFVYRLFFYMQNLLVPCSHSNGDRRFLILLLQSLVGVTGLHVGVDPGLRSSDDAKPVDADYRSEYGSMAGRLLESTKRPIFFLRTLVVGQLFFGIVCCSDRAIFRGNSVLFCVSF